MKYRVFICDLGDIFIFDAESGQHLRSPYGVGDDDTAEPFRRLVVQDSRAITCDNLEEAYEFLNREARYSESWRYKTWVRQIVSAGAQTGTESFNDD